MRNTAVTEDRHGYSALWFIVNHNAYFWLS